MTLDEQAKSYAESICAPCPNTEGVEPLLCISREEVRKGFAAAFITGNAARDDDKTDYQIISDILTTRAPFEAKCDGQNPRKNVRPEFETRADGTKSIEIGNGYDGFVTVFEFNSDEQLVNVSAWE
jgi:hypothetical protein